MKKIAFSLDNVSLERDGKFILRDLSFTVGEGERWVVFGPNGSGKTSLLRIASFYFCLIVTEDGLIRLID